MNLSVHNQIMVSNLSLDEPDQELFFYNYDDQGGYRLYTWSFALKQQT